MAITKHKDGGYQWNGSGKIYGTRRELLVGSKMKRPESK